MRRRRKGFEHPSAAGRQDYSLIKWELGITCPTTSTGALRKLHPPNRQSPLREGTALQRGIWEGSGCSAGSRYRQAAHSWCVFHHQPVEALSQAGPHKPSSLWYHSTPLAWNPPAGLSMSSPSIHACRAGCCCHPAACCDLSGRPVCTGTTLQVELGPSL